MSETGKGAGRNSAEEEEKGVTRITDERDPIAAALRKLYNDAAQEPLPEDLSRLLNQLEAAEKNA